MSITNILSIAAGSALGGVLRYLISRAIQLNASSAFPWGTLAVNLTGCLILGILYGLIDRNFHLSEGLKLFLTVGFCGGFTTLSTFIGEGFNLTYVSHDPWMSLIYIVATVVVGILLLMGGFYAAHLI